VWRCRQPCSTLTLRSSFSFFFFQAEDGIRDRNVTGVQTCALPISPCAHDKIRFTRAFHGRAEKALVRRITRGPEPFSGRPVSRRDRKSTRLNSRHVSISYAVFCLKKKSLRSTASTTLKMEEHAPIA